MIYARGISPPAGGELLCPWRQSNQNAPGDAANGLRLRCAPPRSIGPLSPDPFLRGDALLVCAAMVPARKIRSACLRFLPGHWALSMQNLILLRFTDAPGFAEPTVAVRILAGGPRASPTQFRKVFLRTVGEGLKVNRPKAERSLPGMCPSRGPASVQPLRKQRGRDQIRRRGGPCGRLYSRCES